MAEKYMEEPINRRKFLKGAALTAAAATATGAGASLLSSQRTSRQPPLTQPLTAAIPKSNPDDLIARMAALQAENVRLQADLELAQHRLAAQETAVHETDTAVQTVSAELNAANAGLASANQQIGVLAGLVALYEQLDDADWSAVLEEGLESVSAVIADAVDDLPGLSDGLAWGRQALTELDDHIPLLENGRFWLADQTDKMQRYYTAVEALLETAVDQAGPFLQMFSEWVQKILKWLPFNLGERTSTIMEALTTLLLETPSTLTGLRTNVAEPLDVWLGRPDVEAPLRQNLIKPMQEQVLAKADIVAAKTAQVKTVYEGEVMQRMETAVAARRQIQTHIQSYRQQHQI